jgi:hypothetical protein
MMFGRAFDLYGPRPPRSLVDRILRRPQPERPVIATILPCEFCGNPVFEPEKHTCDGLMDALTAEAERRALEADL